MITAVWPDTLTKDFPAQPRAMLILCLSWAESSDGQTRRQVDSTLEDAHRRLEPYLCNLQGVGASLGAVLLQLQRWGFIRNLRRNEARQLWAAEVVPCHSKSA